MRTQDFTSCSEARSLADHFHAMTEKIQRTLIFWLRSCCLLLRGIARSRALDHVRFIMWSTMCARVCLCVITVQIRCIWEGGGDFNLICVHKRRRKRRKKIFEKFWRTSVTKNEICWTKSVRIQICGNSKTFEWNSNERGFQRNPKDSKGFQNCCARVKISSFNTPES